MAVEEEKRIHLVGIGGAGMSGIARILKEMGKEITGSDLCRSETVQRLEEIGITVYQGHSSANLPEGTDLVVVSSAIPSTNPEMKKAKRLGIPVVKRGDMLACLMNERQGIAVSGAHGKTTTTSMIALMLEDNGFSPTFVIGGEIKESNLGAKLGLGEYFVAEADESDASFLKLNPYIAVVTNVEDDHLDYYKSIESIKEAFVRFISQVKAGGIAVLCHDDPFLAGLKGCFEHLVYYGSRPEADYYYLNFRIKGWGTCFDAFKRNDFLGTVELSIPGRHNALNAMAAIAVGTELGIPFTGIANSLKRFKGAKRRFQVLGVVEDIILIDDYAHHPTEVAQTIKSARQFHQARLIVVFQPHRYTRTKLLGEHFGAAFQGVDLLIVTGVYPAGETPIPGVTGEIIYRSACRSGIECLYMEDPDDIVDYLLGVVRPGDMVIFMGAGDIWKAGEKMKTALNGSYPSG